ncbi:jg11376 [Pararge aegeria aegeria]|uniref:Jg11376 protein n=1 Tax=Pararge aegeria aegeria TaxID=348720 RepID=A0A8S4RNM9_9NEOP|nr:jg11376 [Pararge aegeria aegeria]
MPNALLDIITPIDSKVFSYSLSVCSALRAVQAAENKGIMWISSKCTHQQVGVALSTVSWLACEGDSAPRAPPATDEAVVPCTTLLRPHHAHHCIISTELTPLASLPEKHHYTLKCQPLPTIRVYHYNLLALRGRELQALAAGSPDASGAAFTPNITPNRIYPTIIWQPSRKMNPTHHDFTMVYSNIYKLSRVNYRPDVTINV